MDRVSILCSKDAVLMNEFSRRCIGNLQNHSMFKLFFSIFHDFMDANVQKETAKDRLIIEHAAAIFVSGESLADIDVEGIFEKTKDVGREFIKKIAIFPLHIDIRYADIEDIRKKRIEVLSMMVFGLLNNWKNSLSFADVIKRTYTENMFRKIVKEMLHLYNLETMRLVNSIKLLYPGNIAKDLLAETLFDVMEQMKEDTALEFRKKIYDGDACRSLT